MEPYQVANVSEIVTPDKLKTDGLDYRFITKACEEFERGNYDGCIEIIEQLEESSKDNDYKLQHNKAVAKFYKSSCKDYMNFLKSLEDLDLKEISSVSMDVTHSIFPLKAYNKAVIFYQRHMYQTALDIIEPILKNMDRLDETILSVLGVLELRLLLASNQPRKALGFLEILLQTIGINLINLITDDCNAQDGLTRFDDNVMKNLKLMSLLTHVINKKTILVPEDGSPEFTALKAHQYYIMKDFQMAAKQLKKINVSGYMNGIYNQELNTLIANNMGVIHLRVRHYAIAANFFQNAISFDKHVSCNLRDTNLHHMSSAKSCEILYNLGIAMLHLRRPKEAFQCFLVQLKTYYSNPRLWFRIAESCIMQYEIRRFGDNHSVDMGKNYLYSNRIPYLDGNQSSAVLEPTMTFAALSLRNALALTKFYLQKLYVNHTNEENISNTPEIEDIKWHKIKENNFCPPSGPINKEMFYALLSSVYAAYSYVSLRLGDYATVLKMSEELLNMETLSDAHKMLAHMYAGEALIMTEKISDARKHLEPTLVSNLNTFDFETKDWQVKSLDAAQNVVRYNYAVAMFLQGDIEMARGLLNTCTHPIISKKVQAFKTVQSKILSTAGNSNISVAHCT